MSPLVWLLPLVGVSVLAALWAAWVARPRKPTDMFDSMQAHQRFVDALARTNKSTDQHRRS